MDWIKIDKKIASGSKMVRLVELTNLDVDTLLGRLVRFWSWVDDHVKEDGRLNVTSVTTLVRMFGWDEVFWSALTDLGVCWLSTGEHGYEIPEWDKWFSKSAKQRMASAERKRRSRASKPVTRNGKKKRDASHDEVTPEVTPDRDQKRTEENRAEETRTEQTSSGASNSSRAPTSNGASSSELLPKTRDALECLKDEDGQTRPVDWDAVREECTKIVTDMRGGKCEAVEDRDLVAKVAALMILGALSEHEVRDACVAVIKKAERESGVNRYAYLHGTLAHKLEERQVTFNALLAALTVPEEIRQPRLAAAKP